MALISLKTPSALVAAGNPVNVDVSCMNAFGITYQQKIYSLSFTNVVANSYFEIKLNDRSIHFSAKASPVATGYEYAPGATNEAFVTMFQQCAPIVEAFDILFLSGKVKLVARNGNDTVEIISNGIDVDLLIDNESSIKGIGTRIKVLIMEPYVKAELTRSKIIGSISSEPEVGTKSIILNNKDYVEGIKSFDIQTHLYREKTGMFSFPEEQAEILTPHALCTEFKLIAASISGFPPLSDSAITDSIFALPATLSDMKVAELNSSSKAFPQYLNEQQMWLSWHNEKQTDIYSTERLYYLALTVGTKSLWVKKYYTDGTSLTEKRRELATSIYQVLECRTGYSAIKSTADNSRKIYKYDVWLQNSAGSKLTTVFSYRLDFSYQLWARYFLYKNKFGAYEMLRTTGRMQQKLKTEKTFATVNFPKGYGLSSQNIKQISSVKTETYIVNFGYTLPEQAAYQNEFLESNEVYWLKSGVAIPVQIQNSDITQYDEMLQSVANDFELILGLEDDITLSPEPTLPIYTSGDFDIDFDTDFDN